MISLKRDVWNVSGKTSGSYLHSDDHHIIYFATVNEKTNLIALMQDAACRSAAAASWAIAGL